MLAGWDYCRSILQFWIPKMLCNMYTCTNVHNLESMDWILYITYSMCMS